MNKYTMCCEKCFEMIAQTNTVAAKLWMDFCAFAAENGQPLGILHVDFPELRELENQRFLVSTDVDDSILIRLNGNVQNQSGEQWFCINGSIHGR